MEAPALERDHSATFATAAWRSRSRAVAPEKGRTSNSGQRRAGRDRALGQQTGSKRLKSAWLNHAETSDRNPGNPHG
jgi:hypothetical protein